MEPLKLPGFELVEKVGEGGMAVVWKARQISLDRIVAIKLLSARLARDPDEVRRIQAEARTAAKLKHPGIVQIHDAQETDGLFYIVMEFIAGYSVSTWLKRKPILSEEDALLMAECVAQALQYAWETARLIHCDIKPDNIMVDIDGTIKVADLGLARKGGVAAEQVEEIVGTPSYMSPEQALGQADLDCRTDIYSLGATLYHVLTGKRLFEGGSDTQVIDKQVSHQAADPQDLNSRLSGPICLLVEKMLAKDRSLRPADWTAVIEDIRVVRQGKLPLNRVPPAGASTVRRNKARADQILTAAASPARDRVVRGAARRSPQLRASPSTGRTAAPAFWIALVGVLVLAGLYLFQVQRQERMDEQAAAAAARPALPGAAPAVPVPPAALAPSTPTGVAAQASPGLGSAEELYNFVVAWFAEHPGQYDEAIARFRKVADMARGTKYQLMAEGEIRKLDKSRRDEIASLMARLRAAAERLAGEGRYEEAGTVYSGYTGQWSAETSTERRRAAEEMTRRAHEAEQAQVAAVQRVATEFEQLLNDVADAVLTGGLTRASASVSAALERSAFADRQEALRGVQSVLRSGERVDQRIVDSFRAQIGQRVSVEFAAGARTVVVSAVDGGRVTGAEQVGAGQVSFQFGVADLSRREKVKRLMADESPEAALAMGILAYQTKSFSRATDYFSRVPGCLATALVSRAAGGELRAQNEKAEQAFAAVLRSAGIEVGVYDETPWLEMIRRHSYTPEQRDAGAKMLEKFRSAYGESSFARQAELVVAAFASEVAPGKVGAEESRPEDRGALAPPVDQNAFIDSLIQRNPGLARENIEVGGDGGRINRLVVRSPVIEDLSPVAAVKTLTELTLSADMGRPRVQDLSPLTGLPLTSLSIAKCLIRDFAPVKGLKLRVLDASATPLRDLSLLKDMPLEELYVRDMDLRDISPLKGLKLTVLDLANSRAADVSALREMPLRRLVLEGCPVRDIGPLKFSPLEELNLSRTDVYDFTPLRGQKLKILRVQEGRMQDLVWLDGMKLVDLDVSNSRHVSDLMVLRFMPLERLNVSGTMVKDVTPLKETRLVALDLGDTRVRDLSPLKGLELAELNLAGTSVIDLAPLAGMPLRRLNLANSQVKDLSPLRGMGLTFVDLRGTKITDFAPLYNMPIEELNIDGDFRGSWQIARHFPRLRMVNGQELWRR